MKPLHLITAAVLTLSLYMPASIAYGADTVSISSDQQSLFGIKTVNPLKITTLWSNAYPAEVTIPNNQMTAITSLHTGLVTKLLVTEGMTVKKGELLAEIASPDFLDHQREYLDALTVKNTLSGTLERENSLFKEGIISQKRLNITQASYDQAESQLRQSAQSLSLSGLTEYDIETIRNTRKIIQYMPIRANMNGEVLSQNIHVGESVSPANALYTIGNAHPLWIKVHVPITVIGSVINGNTIIIDSSKISGKIMSISRMIHTADQGVTVIAEINQRTDELIPGQFVSAKIELSSDHASGFKIPRQALISEAGKKYVFKQSARGFTVVEVTIISQEQEHYIIQSTLSNTDKLALTGIATLKGMWLGLGSED